VVIVGVVLGLIELVCCVFFSMSVVNLI